MRLICPNCSAQYEVDASLIPEEGRDVQCSNCGHNWFELPPAAAVPLPPEDLSIAEPEPEEAPAEEPEAAELSPVEAPVAARPELFEEVQPDEERIEEDAEPEGPSLADETAKAPRDEEEDWSWPKTRMVSLDVPKPSKEAPPRPRRPAEVAALDVLKEEAERELQRRREETPAPLETQTDFALQDPARRDTPSRALRARMARLRGEEDDVGEAADDDDYRAPRRDLLPDIDEINSSLRPAGLAREEMSEEEIARQRSGFRTGFIGMMALVIAMILAYAWAPVIANVFPATETALLAYVDWANGARDAIDALFGRAG